MASKRILIVEDNDAARSALTALLADEGYEVRATDRGADASAIARDWRPDVAVVDYKLPDTNGVLVIGSLRELAPGCQIILMTGTAELVTAAGDVHFQDRQEEAFEAGARAYLPKPIDLGALLDELERCFGTD